MEAVDRSSINFLQLQVGELNLTIGKGDIALPVTQASAAAVSPSLAPAATPTAAAPAQSSDTPAAVQQAATPAKVLQAIPDGTSPVVAPIGGRFYAKPHPGAEAFVKLGSEVDENMTVGLIEVMKVFNAIPAGLKGIVAQICVEDAEIVEAGQVLFRVRT